MKEAVNQDKNLAEMYFKIYNGCMKYNIEKKKEEVVNCQEYYDQFLRFTEKYMDSKTE
jgi:benzoyl-CoA reductase/2-hydroxyglutaryl-CoA dehydratase subunit BcrC/BadD/HgdB